jgi:hypothetical protein
MALFTARLLPRRVIPDRCLRLAISGNHGLCARGPDSSARGPAVSGSRRGSAHHDAVCGSRHGSDDPDSSNHDPAASGSSRSSGHHGSVASGSRHGSDGRGPGLLADRGPRRDLSIHDNCFSTSPRFDPGGPHHPDARCTSIHQTAGDPRLLQTRPRAHTD